MRHIIMAVAIPCFVLLSLVIYNEVIFLNAPEYELEIEGYDPRDLLSGHYLNFRVKYDGIKKCDAAHSGKALVCVRPATSFHLGSEPPADCTAWIQGSCQYGTFTDGLHRFYVPQKNAVPLEAALRNGGKGTIKVSLQKGRAQIRDLHVDGKSWRSFE